MASEMKRIERSFIIKGKVTMKEQTVTDAQMRQFLLGNVDDEERQRIESLFISDPESREKIEVAEQDLIEDYLENGLTTDDKEKFLSHYAQTPEQRRKLRIAGSIKDYAIAKQQAAQTDAPMAESWRNWFSAWWQRKPTLLVPITATLIVAVMVAGVWLVRLNNRRSEDDRQRVAIERELAELNGPSGLSDTSPRIVLLVVSPLSVRSIAPRTELTPGDSDRVVELRLLWIQKEQYPTYQAVLHRVGDPAQFTIPNLHLQNENGSAVRVRLPARLLTRGLYQVILSGISSDGSARLVEEYSFTAGK